MPVPEPLIHEKDPVNLEWPVSLQTGWLTPAARFYERNHFRLPQPPSAPWSLEVGGAVTAPRSIALWELKRLPAVSRWVTLECAGNKRGLFDPPAEGAPWRDGAVGTAEWTGVPLRTVLQRAGIRSGAHWVRFTGADAGRFKETGQWTNFERALPLAAALGPDVLLAYAMNGEALPHKHGGPVRLIVPGWYAMASVKWLTRIEVRLVPFRGPFQVRDYVMLPEPGAYDQAEPVTAIRVNSVITFPADGAAVPPGDLPVTGLAWSGAAPVTRVEVSPDGGARWLPAELAEPVAQHAWRRWHCVLPSMRPGQYRLLARAADGAGNVQPAQAAWNAKGYSNNQTIFCEITVTLRRTERS